MKLVSSVLRKLHTSDVKLNNTFDVFDSVEHYETLLKNAAGKNFEDYYETKEKVLKLKQLLKDLGAELKPSHNDTVPENFVKSGEDKIYLIDWEYSGMNDPMWDLAAHSLECGFSEDDEELFLQTYFGALPDENIRKRILIHKICQDFLWSIWTNIKEAKGDDFGTYGIDRYNRAKKNLQLL
jgi:thiamine kinase-like enzyme